MKTRTLIVSLIATAVLTGGGALALDTPSSTQPTGASKLDYSFGRPISPRQMTPHPPMMGGMYGPGGGMGGPGGMYGSGAGMMGRGGRPGATQGQPPIYDKRENAFFLTMTVTGGPGLAKAAKPEDKDIPEDDPIRPLRPSADLRENIVYIREQGRPAPAVHGAIVDDYVYKVGLAAPTAEKALAKAQQLLDVANNWWTANRTPYINYQIDRVGKELAEAGRTLQTQHKAIEAERALLCGLEGMSKETRKNLETRRVNLEIEIEGAEARIDATRKLFDALPEDPPAELNRTIETLRISAQIDLAGLLAQRQRIREVLDADRRLRGETGKLHATESLIANLKSALVGLEKQSKTFKPFQITGDGKALIQTIDWNSVNGR